MMENRQNGTETGMTFERIDHYARLAASSDKLAFVELCAVFQPYVTVTARSFRLPQSEFDDLCQIGRMALYRAVLTHTASRGSFVPYARVCIRNAMISFVRRYMYESKHTGPSLDEEDAPETVSRTEMLPEERVMIEEFMNEVTHAIKTVLSETERTVMTYKLEGYGVAEISVLIGKDAKSVENTLFRARRKLRGALSAPIGP